MTNREALIAEVAPYNPGDVEVLKALQDAGLDTDGEYEDSGKVAKAAVDILVRALALSSESDHMFSQSYNLEGLRRRLYYIARKHGIEIDLCEDDCKKKEETGNSFIRKIP